MWRQRSGGHGTIADRHRNSASQAVKAGLKEEGGHRLADALAQEGNVLAQHAQVPLPVFRTPDASEREDV